MGENYNLINEYVFMKYFYCILIISLMISSFIAAQTTVKYPFQDTNKT